MGVQYTFAPQSPSWIQSGVFGQEPWGNPHRLGSSVRNFRTGRAACDIRADEKHRDVQPTANCISRMGGYRSRPEVRTELARPLARSVGQTRLEVRAGESRGG